ncbi:MAG: hypothetical protein GY739_17015 [Mesoflavibacter sp.]|nr:hypothetical protein [Mesoflavibacter sp.]
MGRFGASKPTWGSVEATLREEYAMEHLAFLKSLQVDLQNALQAALTECFKGAVTQLRLESDVSLGDNEAKPGGKSGGVAEASMTRESDLGVTNNVTVDHANVGHEINLDSKIRAAGENLIGVSDEHSNVQTLILEATHKELQTKCNQSLYRCGLKMVKCLDLDLLIMGLKDFDASFIDFSIWHAKGYIIVAFCRKGQMKRLNSFWHSGKIKLKLHERFLRSCYLIILIESNFN